MLNRRDLIGSICFFGLLFSNPLLAQNIRFNITGTGRQTIIRNEARINYIYRDKKIKPGAKAFIRIINSENKLELWLYANDKYKFIREYNICANTKNIGIYSININTYDSSLNNNLRINLSGSSPLFIQAKCATSQAISLTDTDLGELYSLLFFAFRYGQKTIPVHIFPYRMTQLNMLTKQAKTQKIKNLARTYQSFENGNRLR